MPPFKTRLIIIVLTLLVGITLLVSHLGSTNHSAKNSELIYWSPPDTSAIPLNSEGELIRYGRELVTATSIYLGPKGKIEAISNGMNCQNCHLNAGTKFWGNNYGAVAATYPKYRDRSGSLETIAKRVNDCIERSLNGKALDSNSREMKAFQAYLRWVGSNVPLKIKPIGSNIIDLVYDERGADSTKGRELYKLKCQSCHAIGGKGLLNKTGNAYIYPPLWGDNSYNTAAGLYRILKLAGFIKDNMPVGSSHDAPRLTDEEALDVAAFINSQPRPLKNFTADWPDISRKPIDYPFGPYTDSFSEFQHKFGPFGSIKQAHRITSGAPKK
ncbi:MAG: c-type cytochrome [Chitinophagaceae bacterium]